MLLICPVRPGDRNEELRYALRSWEANLLLPGGLELLVVGHCPPWLQPDQFVPEPGAVHAARGLRQRAPRLRDRRR